MKVPAVVLSFLLRYVLLLVLTVQESWQCGLLLVVLVCAECCKKC